MASYRSYGDTGAYRPRGNVGIAAGTFGRTTTSTGSGLPGCRNSYSSSIGSGSSRVHGKERVSGFGNAFLKKDKFEEKPTFKYSANKDADKNRLHPSRSSTEDVGAKSPLSSSRSSLFEKYSFPATKASERPASVLDRYNRATSREKSREPDGVSRYGSNTYPGSSLARTYGNESRIEKKERSDHPPVSYRGLRPNSGRSSREPSPEVNVGKSNSFRMYSRAPSYGRSSATSSASESSSAPISSRFGSTAGSRFLSSRSSNDRIPAAISYSGSDRFRTSGSKPMPANLKDEDTVKSNVERNATQEKRSTPVKSEELKVDNRLQDNETVTMVTRGTSPSLPASSSFVRSRRADIGIANQREVARVRKKTETKNQEVQSERLEDASRFSRFGGGGRISGTPWSTYLDKFSSNSSGSGVYARGFNGGTTNSRVNSFAFSRSNDASRNDSTSKLSPSSSQEIHGNRNQNEQSTKAFGGLGFAVTKTDSKASTGNDPSNSNQTEVKAHNGEVRPCSVGKIEVKTSRLANPSVLKRDNSPHQPGVVKSPDSRENTSKSEEQQSSRESSTSKSEDSSQRRPSIPRLGRIAMKNEGKVTKSSSSSSTKSDGLRERRSSTPKSDTSSLSKLDESSRIVEGHCQGQSKEVSASKSDSVSSTKDSFQSNSSQSRSTTPQSRSGSTKNLCRQMTRTDSSEGSAVNVPIGRSKSTSASSVTSQGAKIKATPPPSPGKSSASTVSSVNLRQGGSPDARGKPPVPKSDATSVSASKSIVPVKYVNKDFRKSTLNMENGDPSQSKYSRKKKNQRSMSVSSQDSQSEPNSEPNIHRPAAPSESSSSSVKSNRSRLRMPSSGTSSKSIGRKSESTSSLRPENSRSSSKSPSGKRSKQDGSSSSSGVSESNSSNSSSSEEEDDNKQTRPGSRRRKRRTSKSPFCEKKGKISAGSSRTSVLASSTDEMSLTMDKPPRPPSSPRSKSDRSGKTEEAKSFLMRALAPVTNLFKNKHQDSSESGKSGGWLDSNEESTDAKKSEQNGTIALSKSLSKSFSFTNSEKNDDKRHSSVRIRRNFSGEQPWWMDPNSDNVPEGVETGSVCNEDISQETTVSSTLPDDGKFKYKVWRQESEERAWWLDSNDSAASEDARKQSTTILRQESGEKAWWLDSNDNVPSEETQRQSSATVLKHDSGDRGRWLDGNDSVLSDDAKKLSRPTIWRQESGERAWWLDANDSVPSEESKKQSSMASPVSKRESSRSSTRSNERRNRLRHQQSGEQAWWMNDNPENVPEGVEVIPVATTPTQKNNSYNDEVDDSQTYNRSINKVRHIESGEKPWWMDSSSNVPDGVVKIPIETSNSTSDSSESFEKIDIGVNPEPEIYAKRNLSRFPIEFPPPPPDEPLGDRASPEGVENPPDPPDNYGGRDSPYDNVQTTPRRSSPRKRPSTLPLFIGQHTNIDDLLGDATTLCPSPVLSRIRKRERIGEDSAEESSECEEIDATQVIIHDSTPQTPVIQRRHRDNERPQPDGYIPVAVDRRASTRKSQTNKDEKRVDDIPEEC
ncbi:serine/arginine repetitive matrix protein 2-like isoform X3 [Bombus huntii]|uniref:serine/arginine repetitive matrix protein 2-like isoform X3 n=1 Tax=Bombus huntii TaxID=85661 RepID=UPI0021AABA00|nr:serine/arginine repetitive matrix protein 2-like isoform X3 [Bombus huntii]